MRAASSPGEGLGTVYIDAALIVTVIQFQVLQINRCLLKHEKYGLKERDRNPLCKMCMK